MKIKIVRVIFAGDLCGLGEHGNMTPPRLVPPSRWTDARRYTSEYSDGRRATINKHRLLQAKELVAVNCRLGTEFRRFVDRQASSSACVYTDSSCWQRRLRLLLSYTCIARMDRHEERITTSRSLGFRYSSARLIRAGDKVSCFDSNHLALS